MILCDSCKHRPVLVDTRAAVRHVLANPGHSITVRRAR